jgi:hypothetical protein
MFWFVKPVFLSFLGRDLTLSVPQKFRIEVNFYTFSNISLNISLVIAVTYFLAPLCCRIDPFSYLFIKLLMPPVFRVS